MLVRTARTSYRNEHKMFRFLFNAFHVLLVLICSETVHMEELGANLTYVLGKLAEIDFEMQKVLEKLGHLEEIDQQKTEKIELLENMSAQPLIVNSLETDGWHMVFRAIAGNGQDVYNAWTTGKGTCTTKPLTMQRSYLCHYRDNRVSNWASLGIKYVKFAFYDRFHEVAYVIFRGSWSNIKSWFDKSRVISSSWPDLTTTSIYNFFSIEGFAEPPIAERRFYISNLHNGCSADTGHMVVVNNVLAAPNCPWETHKSYPQFLYSKLNSVDVWQRKMYGAADFLTIFIKT